MSLVIKLVVPDSQHCPAKVTEESRHSFVSRLIAR
jgi:hypothetical protein